MAAHTMQKKKNCFILHPFRFLFSVPPVQAIDFSHRRHLEAIEHKKAHNRVAWAC
jgi:hypothetical protein